MDQNTVPRSAPSARREQAQLVALAADVLRRRRDRGRYHELPDEAFGRLLDALLSAASSQSTSAGPTTEMVAFAHRIIDDDHPEDDPLWRGAAPAGHPHSPTIASPLARQPPAAASLPDPRDLPDDGLGQGPALGRPAATPVDGWR